MTDAPILPAAPRDPGSASIFGPVHLTRAMICVVAVIFAIVFKYVAQWIHWPSEYGFAGSLTQPPMRLGAFVICLILLVVCTALGTLVLGRRWYLAGLMTATAGLAMWSVRGGTMMAVLFNADNSGAGGKVFLSLLGELIVFFGVIGAMWTLIWNMSGRAFVSGSISDEAREKQLRQIHKVRLRGLGLFNLAVLGMAATARGVGASTGEDERQKSAVAILFQTVVMAVLLLFMAVTPLKKQALTCVFLAGMIATAAAEVGGIGTRATGRWYWIAPLIVGAVGYIAAYLNPAGIETGDLQGMFAPLARLLPLDYASMGCAGVLFGYWWMEPDAEAPTEADEVDGSGRSNEGANPLPESPEVPA